MTRFWNNLHQVQSQSKDWKVFGSKKPKGLNKIAKISWGRMTLRTIMALWFISTYVINVVSTVSSWRVVLDRTLLNKICQWLLADQISVFSGLIGLIKPTLTEILLKVVAFSQHNTHPIAMIFSTYIQYFTK